MLDLASTPIHTPTTLEFTATLLTAFLASFHCAGMCGGFSLAATSKSSTGLSQFLYHSGKTVAYLFLGLIVTQLSKGLASNFDHQDFQKGLALIAGIFLIAIGLHSLGFRIRGTKKKAIVVENLNTGESPTLLTQFKGFLQQIYQYSGKSRPLILGMLSGFLPCPLVYAFALKAASDGSEIASLLTMLSLGLGTVPILVFIAYAGQRFHSAWRVGLVRTSGVLMILLGLFTWIRGWTGLPFCH